MSLPSLLHGGGGGTASADAVHSTTLALRIAGIFIIAAVSFACMLPPILMKMFADPSASLPRLTRAFGGGVILSLAMVGAPPPPASQQALQAACPLPAAPPWWPRSRPLAPHNIP